MTLIHRFRRYEAWNPVHPTAGAFQGIGVGLGCGLGWGPGFGPEVVGYVGAGCGVGVHVGVTLVGLGVGQNMAPFGIAALPWNALRSTTRAGLSRRKDAVKALVHARNVLRPSASNGVALLRNRATQAATWLRRGLTAVTVGAEQGAVGQLTSTQCMAVGRSLPQLPRPIPIPMPMPVAAAELAAAEGWGISTVAGVPRTLGQESVSALTLGNLPQGSVVFWRAFRDLIAGVSLLRTGKQ